jgi:hypothetical protein
MDADHFTGRSDSRSAATAFGSRTSAINPTVKPLGVLSTSQSVICWLRLEVAAARSVRAWPQLPPQVGPGPMVEGLRTLLASAGPLPGILQQQVLQYERKQREASRVHHAARRRGCRVAARGARAAGAIRPFASVSSATA